MTSNRNSLIYALLLVAAIVVFGYFAAGDVVFLFSATFVGGLILWTATTYRADIDPNKIIVPYLLTVIFFIGHVYEEYTSHIEVALGAIMHIQLTQHEFLTVAAFIGPVIWLAGAMLILIGVRLGYFLVSVFLFGMMFGELSHFAFPFMENGKFHYVAGMYTCALPIASAWYTFLIMSREAKRQRMRLSSASAAN
jgi:hypothetical protein